MTLSAYTQNHELLSNFSGITCAIARVERDGQRESRVERFTVERARNEAGIRIALKEMFHAEGFPEPLPDEAFSWRHNGWGQPFVRWRGAALDWADARGYSDNNLHVSNTHDGTAHLVFAAYSEMMAGIGIDAVYLPRLQNAGKGRDYLRRFAAQFMSEEELSAFLRAAESDTDAEFTVRAAAHFSLMEAASKACGTGLKIGVGMGKAFSLPKRSIEIRRLAPTVELAFTGEAQNRIEQMGVITHSANWVIEGDYLISVVVLFKGGSAGK